MKNGIHLLALGHTASLFLAIAFTVCVVFDLVFPDMAVYETWRRLLPGFEWLTWKSYIVGLVESYGYGWYFALIWVPLYIFFLRRPTS
jgi:cytochrome c biogenesis protein CcdA